MKNHAKNSVFDNLRCKCMHICWSQSETALAAQEKSKQNSRDSLGFAELTGLWPDPQQPIYAIPDYHGIAILGTASSYTVVDIGRLGGCWGSVTGTGPGLFSPQVPGRQGCGPQQTDICHCNSRGGLTHAPRRGAPRLKGRPSMSDIEKDGKISHCWGVRNL